MTDKQYLNRKKGTNLMLFRMAEHGRQQALIPQRYHCNKQARHHIQEVCSLPSASITLALLFLYGYG